MDRFPEFMRNPANRIARSNQATPGVEGYVFDGADQSQMAFWTCTQTATSAEHVHEFDDYMLVVQGCYTLLIDGRRIAVTAGEQYLISGAACMSPVAENPVLVPNRELEDDKKPGESEPPRIRCPLCGWSPRKDDKWFCECGHAWNTFDTGGVSRPACISAPGRSASHAAATQDWKGFGRETYREGC